MIKLDVADYCHECKCFETDVRYPKVIYYNGSEMYDTEDVIVRCEYREKCANAVKFAKGEKNDSN